MQFLHTNLARDSGNDSPVVPGRLMMRHEFGGGGTRQSYGTQTVTRTTPPPAPSPLAASRPTQSVADLLTSRRRPPSGRSGTILTRDGSDGYGATGRRTVLGTPIG